ncbi:unnamed protein product, partial [marine sediment metagenome]
MEAVMRERREGDHRACLRHEADVDCSLWSQHALRDAFFYYHGDRVLAEYDYTTGTPGLLRYYIDGPTYVDEHILVHDDPAGNEYYYLLKELYTVAGMADQDGNITEAYN